MNTESTSNEDQPDPITSQPSDQSPNKELDWDDFLTVLFEPSNIYAKDRAILDALPNRYPRLFPEGELTWGFQISPGWSNLIALLCARVDAILQSVPQTRMHVNQVKEKFGHLRFYYEMEGESTAVRDAIRRAIAQAEEASAMCCEKCGERAETSNSRGWLRTLCPRCSANVID